MITYLFIRLSKMKIHQKCMTSQRTSLLQYDDRKYLVYESCLKPLLMVCTVCLTSCCECQAWQGYPSCYACRLP